MGCSASGADKSSETNNTGSTSNTGTSGTTGLNIGGSDGLNLAGNAATSGGTTGMGCGTVLPVVYRDFNAYGQPGGHDDFEASARGIHNKNADGSDGGLYTGWNDVGCELV